MITGKDWGKEGIEYLSLYRIIRHQVPWAIQQCVHIFPKLSVDADIPAETFLTVLRILHQINLQVIFLTPMPTPLDSDVLLNFPLV